MKVFTEDRKFKIILATIASVIALVTYLLTMAPTVSFWDCGEFIAAAHTMGIPHPPGTPFFNIIGRVVIVALPFVGEIAARMNLISVVTSAATIFFCFLIAWDVLSNMLLKEKLETSMRRFICGVGAFTAAFLVTFSDTFWFNAVEAEVYGMAMLFVFIITWLTLLWSRNHDNTLGNRLLVLIVYLSYLGVGIHMYSLITMPAIFLFVIWVRPDFRKFSKSWPIFITGVLLYSIVYMMANFLVITLILTAIMGVLSLAMSENTKPYYKLSFWFCLAAIVGYSTHAYIPLRSALNPIIDENNPEISNVWDSDAWEPFNQFIERKQYGSESMITRAFHRRGSIGNQILTFPHMGYGGYQFAQYLPWKVGEVSFRGKGKWVVAPELNGAVVRGSSEFQTQMSLFGESKIVQAFYFLLMNGLLFWICWLVYKRNPAVGFFLGFVFTIVSFGLIFYMNFGDGTQPSSYFLDVWERQGKPAGGPQLDHLEVRERDYFYTPAFVLMGIIYGIGLGTGLLSFIKKGKLSLVKPVGITGLILAFAIPCFSNYKEHNRDGLFVPWDYAYNLIQSAKPNAVIFTNGDNDTFPLWFIQEVENIRKDVRVVNLSLGNTVWYINQMLANEPKLKLGLLKDNLATLSRGIDKRSFEPIVNKRLSVITRELPKQDSLLKLLTNPIHADSLQIAMGSKLNQIVENLNGNLKRMKNDLQVFTAYNKWKKKYQSGWIKVQDLVVMDIVLNNLDKPIHFATTVGKENFVGLDNFMTMEGMVYTLDKYSQTPPPAFNLERTVTLLDSVYQFRGINDGTYINDETMRLLYNYNGIFVRIALDAREKIQRSKALISQLRQSNSVTHVGTIESKMKQDAGLAIKYLSFGKSKFPKEWRLYLLAAEVLQSVGDLEGAREWVKIGLEEVESWDKRYLEQKSIELGANGVNAPIAGNS